MSGKTVYNKTIAILQILAQVTSSSRSIFLDFIDVISYFQLGCYVPAKSAQFRITDRVFSRIGFNDSIERNMSTFIMEVICPNIHSSSRLN